MDLQTHYQQFVDRQAEVLALAVQDMAQAQLMAQIAGVSFPILADPNHHVAEAYGVFNLLGDGVATPAVFIIDKSGQLVWSYIGQNINDRPGSQTILENVP